MTFPLNEMYGYSRLCDRLRSSAIIWKQLSLRSSAIRDRLRSYGNQPLMKRHLPMQMCNVETCQIGKHHFRLPYVAQKSCMLKLPNNSSFNLKICRQRSGELHTYMHKYIQS